MLCTNDVCVDRTLLYIVVVRNIEHEFIVFSIVCLIKKVHSCFEFPAALFLLLSLSLYFSFSKMLHHRLIAVLRGEEESVFFTLLYSTSFGA